MQVQLESTTKFVTVNGVPARVWEGRTSSGIPVHAYITRIAVHEDQDHAEFERELQACRSPSVDVAALPHKLIL